MSFTLVWSYPVWSLNTGHIPLYYPFVGRNGPHQKQWPLSQRSHALTNYDYHSMDIYIYTLIIHSPTVHQPLKPTINQPVSRNESTVNNSCFAIAHHGDKTHHDPKLMIHRFTMPSTREIHHLPSGHGRQPSIFTGPHGGNGSGAATRVVTDAWLSGFGCCSYDKCIQMF